MKEPVQEQGAQILRFPSNPETVKQLKMDETLLMEELNRVETYDERVEIRKELKKVRLELSAVLHSITWKDLKK